MKKSAGIVLKKFQDRKKESYLRILHNKEYISESALYEFINLTVRDGNKNSLTPVNGLVYSSSGAAVSRNKPHFTQSDIRSSASSGHLCSPAPSEDTRLV